MAEIKESIEVPMNASPVPLAGINQGGCTTPLFCAYGLFIYGKLARHLGADQPTYGLYGRAEEALVRAADPESAEGLPGIRELARDYLVGVRSIQPRGPYQLAGESMGGLIAYEMAQQLVSVGERVALLAILDMTTPETIRNRIRKLCPSGTTGYLDRSIMNDELLDMFGGSASGGGEPADSSTENARRTRLGVITAYYPEPYDGYAVLFRSEQSRSGAALFDDDCMGWRTLLGDRLTVHDVPGRHIEIVREPHVNELANKLRPHLRDAL